MSNLDISDSMDLSADELKLLDYLLEQEGLDIPKLRTIFPRGEQSALPLSFAQERLWFLDQWDPGAATYNVPSSMRLVGRLDVGALRASLNAVIQRHEALRTSFPAANGLPAQVIAACLALRLPLVDLQALPDALREDTALRLLTAGARGAFDLASGPLVRALLIRLTTAEHAFLLNMHHIVCDGWSMAIFIQELAALYRAFTLGQSSPLPDLAIQYADFAIWQREWLQGEVLDAQLAYWRAQLGDHFPVLELPTDRPRPPVQTNRGAREAISIADATVAALRALCQEEEATQFMALLAGFKLLLARYSGQTDIIVGAPIANRDLVEIEGLIGFFVNTLVLRTDLARPASFRELLQQVRDTTIDAQTHQNIPFELLVEKLQSERDPSRTALFQVMFVLQNTPPAVYELPDLTMRAIIVETGTAKFDLLLNLGETPHGLRGAIEYNSDLFDAATIRRMRDHFQNLLGHAAADPAQRLAALPLLSEAEREQIVAGWNATEVDYPLNALAYELVAAQAARTPDAIALICQQQHLSYAELERRANQLAHCLRAAGVGPEIPVALCLERSPELVVAALAVLKAGGAYVPLDPSYPPERLAFMLVDSRAPVLITTTKDEGRRTKDDLEASQTPIVNRTSKIVNLDVDWPLIAQLPSTLPVRLSELDNLAYVIYTSGSTGQPKGVEVSHRGLLNLVQWHQQTYQPTCADRTMLIAGVGFDAVVWELWPQLAAGTSIDIPDDDTRGSPLELHKWLIERELTLCFLPTPLAEAMLTLEWPVASPLRYILTGGDRLRQPPSSASGFRLINHYGPTEATVLATCAPIRPQMNAGELPPIGRPIANTQVYVLDRQLQPVPLGVAGELYIGGVQLARGYLGRPDLTAERFVPNPFAEVSGAGCRVSEDKLPDTRYLTPATRLYKTGDLARLRATGTLDFLGRIDQQVKLRGYRIELGEIEAALTAHPTVREAVLLLREDVPGLPHLVAYVVPAETLNAERSTINGPEWSSSAFSIQRSALEGDLRTFLAERLPEYMLPSAFVLLDALPLTPNGKLDRTALPPPDQDRSRPTSAEPRTPTEELLAGIWAEVLRRDQVGVDDNFFALGGHSLLATQVIARVRQLFTVELPLRDLFAAPTLAGLAARVRQLQQAANPLPQPPVQPQPRGTIVPLSFAQQRLWFLAQLDPTSSAYHLPYALQLTGPLDLAALVRTLAAVVARHESLRTTFALHDGQPMQQIAPPATPALPLYDLRALVPTQQVPLVQMLVRYATQTPFDLTHGPLLRIVLLRLATDAHVLLLTMHHIISDGWSVGVLVRELTQLYVAFRRGQALTLPPLPIQYADYALWQRQWLQGAALDAQLAYWRRSLADAPALLELPTDHPRPAVLAVAGASQPLRLDTELTRELHTLSRQAGTTLFMTLLAAFDVLLARWSGQSDILVGTPIANRTQAATEGLIGFFVNTLVLRTQLRGAASFEKLLEQVRATCLDAYAHQDVPFEQLVELLQPVRDLSSTPLFQVMLVLQNAPQTALDFGELTLRPLANPSTSAKFDLTLTLSETARGLVGSIEYRTTLFEATTITRLGRHLTTLLAGIVADSTQRIAALPLLTAAERAQLLVAWNDTASAYPDDQCVQQLFAAQALRTPDAVALVYETQQLSYRALAQRVNQLAWLLRARGVRPEVLVGICLPRSLELVIGLLGVLTAGGAYLPLDPSYPAARLAFMLDDAQAQVLLTDQGDTETRRQGDKEIAQLAVSLSPDLLVSRSIIDLRAAWPQLAQQPVDAPSDGVTSDNPAYVLYTSGSTGSPKGVLVTHRGLGNYLRWSTRAYTATGGSDAPVHSPLGFDLTITSLFVPLLMGQSAVLLPEEAGVAALSAALLASRDFSLVKLTPTHLTVLSQLLPPEAAAGRARALVIGGEALQAEQLRFWQQHAPATRLLNEYGPTETVVGCCVYEVPLDSAAVGEIAIGRPSANTQLYLLDAHMQPVPSGVVGELYVGGAQLARGYLGRPDLTAERFVPNPFAEVSGAGCRVSGVGISDTRYPAPDTRLYKTGDLARYRPDGIIEYLGRRDEQVKLRGYRIELGEIETMLTTCPAVRAAAVLLRTYAPDDQRLVAYVVPVTDDRPSTIDHQQHPGPSSIVHRPSSIVSELRTFLAERLPEYMLPSAFVLLDALPLTPNGKLDRRALPAPDQTIATTGYLAPHDATEELLAGIWAHVLGRERLGLHDNFFELGGHSLLATQVIARIRDAFAVELPLRTLFETPTVAGLAAQLERSRHDHVGLTAPALVPARRTAALPLSFAQARLWFLDQLDPGSSTYNIPTPVRLTGALDVAALQASFSAILARHEALRTTFQLVDGQPIQVIAAPTTLALAQVDLCALPAEVRETVAQRLVRSEARAPFDLGRGPLVRTTLLRLDAQTHILLINMHHIISDGWSVGVLIRELSQLYAAFRTGQTLTLPPLPIQYADYALWQRQWLQGAALDAQLAYWRRSLADAPALLELPTDHPRPAVLSVAGASQPLRLDAALTRGLHTLSRQAGTTLFMTLLAAFDVLLARWSGQSDILVGTPIANRTQAATEELIGCFVNTLVLRTQLHGAHSFGTLLEQVRATCLDAYAHQDVPFEQLVELLQPVRDLSTTPLFQVMLVLQNTPQTALDFGELTLRPLANPSTSAKFDLTLTLSETARGLVGSIEYRTTLFEATTITRLGRHLTTLLTGIIADPASRIAALPLLTAAERAQLLVAWNDTASANPDDQCVHQLFAAQATHTPDAVALVYETEQLTYQALAQRVNQLAWLLRARGVRPELLVGICLPRSLELVIGLLGVLTASGAYLLLDPSYPAARLAFMLDDAQAQVLITIKGSADKENGRQGDTEIDKLLVSLPPCLDRVLDLRTAWPQLAQQPVDAPSDGVTSDNPAYVIYTSGSTGMSKGAVISHQALRNHMCWLLQAYPLTTTDRLLQKTAIGFDASVWEFYAPLLAGAQLVLAEPGGQCDSAYLVRTIIAQQISLVQLVPAALRALLEEPGFAGCRSLRRVFCGGDVLPRDLQARFAATLDASLHNFYGPTEATIDTLVWNCADEATDQAIPIGRPIANTQVYVLDRQLQPVPIGVAGELYIGGASLARGYLGRPDLTAERFVPNPWGSGFRVQGSGRADRAPDTRYPVPDTRLYKTGDHARYRPDGIIEYLGRRDEQVKLRGYRIELGEIETVLAACPAVRAAAVLLRTNAPDDQHLIAYVVPVSDDRPSTIDHQQPPAPSSIVHRPSSTISDLRAFLAERLPEYMLPSAFVLLDALPLTPSGKLDRNALPAPDQRADTPVVVGARDRLELQLVQLWEELLAVRPIGVKDSFFALGGHSLLAVRLMARLRELTGVALPLATLFRHPTIAQLAQLLRDQTAPAAASALVGITTGGSKRPLFCIHPLGGNVLCYAQLARQLGPEQPVYGIQAPGLEHDQVLPSTVEAMAQEYVAAIRTVQSAGPYLLCGWSIGGVIALEIAQQLVAQGQVVALLALLDSFVSQPTEVWVPNERQLLVGMARQLGLALDAAALQSLDAEQQLAYALAQAQRSDALLPGLDLAQFQRLFAVYKANAQALLHYTPRPYAGRVTLFRAEDAPAGLDCAAGWHAIARDGVMIYDVPGAHDTMLQEPHAGVLAEQLNAAIAQSPGEASMHVGESPALAWRP